MAQYRNSNLFDLDPQDKVDRIKYKRRDNLDSDLMVSLSRRTLLRINNSF
jgi:hypothetical protein